MKEETDPLKELLNEWAARYEHQKIVADFFGELCREPFLWYKRPDEEWFTLETAIGHTSLEPDEYNDLIHFYLQMMRTGVCPVSDSTLVAYDTFCRNHKPSEALEALRRMLEERGMVTIDINEARRNECARLMYEARHAVEPLSFVLTPKEDDDEPVGDFTASPRQVILLLRELGLDLTNLAKFNQTQTALLLSKIIGKDKQNIRRMLGVLATDNGKQTQKDLAIVRAEIAKIKV